MQDVLEGNWKEIRGQLKEWWGDLTDDDLTMIDGKRDKLVGALQKRYGWTKEQAETQLQNRLNDYARAKF